MYADNTLGELKNMKDDVIKERENISKVTIDRNEERGSTTAAKWILSGAALKERSDLLLHALRGLSPAIDKLDGSPVPFIFVADMISGTTSKTGRNDMMSLFSMPGSHDVLGPVGTDRLLIKLSSREHAELLENRLHDIEKYARALSCLENLEAFEPSVDYDDGKSEYKVKLINFQDVSINQSMQELFEDSLGVEGISYTKTYYTPSLPIYCLKVYDKSVMDVLSGDDRFKMISSIETMPSISLNLY